MRKAVPAVVFLILAAALAPLAAQVATTDRWVHVRIEKTGEDGESVRINAPISVALKVLPAIHSHELRDGKVKIHDAHINGVDVRMVLEAIRGLGDGEFITIQGKAENVRVAKEKGYLIVNMDEQTGSRDKIRVKIPLRIVDALLSGAEDELDLLAGVQALNDYGEELVVSVESQDESVRVWVDSKSTAE